MAKKYGKYKVTKKQASNKKPANKSVKESFPHFRRYKVSNHPALIVEEHSADEYAYRKVTHSEKEGRHLNEKVDPNPNPRDSEPMYIVKRVRHDKKKNFSSWKYPWSYPGQKKK